LLRYAGCVTAAMGRSRRRSHAASAWCQPRQHGGGAALAQSPVPPKQLTHFFIGDSDDEADVIGEPEDGYGGIGVVGHDVGVDFTSDVVYLAYVAARTCLEEGEWDLSRIFKGTCAESPALVDTKGIIGGNMECEPSKALGNMACKDDFWESLARSQDTVVFVIDKAEREQPQGGSSYGDSGNLACARVEPEFHKRSQIVATIDEMFVACVPEEPAVEEPAVDLLMMGTVDGSLCDGTLSEEDVMGGDGSNMACVPNEPVVDMLTMGMVDGFLIDGTLSEEHGTGDDSSNLECVPDEPVDDMRMTGMVDGSLSDGVLELSSGGGGQEKRAMTIRHAGFWADATGEDEEDMAHGWPPEAVSVDGEYETAALCRPPQEVMIGPSKLSMDCDVVAALFASFTRFEATTCLRVAFLAWDAAGGGGQGGGGHGDAMGKALLAILGTLTGVRLGMLMGSIQWDQEEKPEQALIVKARHFTKAAETKLKGKRMRRKYKAWLP
jgi:hypothetical protein